MRQYAIMGAIVLIGCGPQAPEPFVVVDSAGVSLALNGTQAGGPTPVSVSREPSLTIGASSGEAHDLLFRVADARRAEDGRIAVADGGSNEIRIFGDSGEFIVAVGRAGDGPGEFRGLSRVRWLPSGLWAFDRALRRATTLDASGNVVSTVEMGFFPLGGRDQTFSDVRQTSDGRWVGLDWSHLSDGEWPSISLDTAYWGLRAVDGTVQEIAQVSGARTVRFEVDGQGLFRTLPLTGIPSWDLARDAIVYTSGSAYEVRISNVEGQVLQVIRRALSRSPVTPEAIRSWQESVRRIAQGETAPEQLERFFAAVPMADSIPVYDAVHVDPMGRIWAQVSTRASIDADATWDLYNPDGQFLGEATTPVGLRVTQVGDDFVVGVRADEFGVEYVQLHGLSGPG